MTTFQSLVGTHRQHHTTRDLKRHSTYHSRFINVEDDVPHDIAAVPRLLMMSDTNQLPRCYLPDQVTEEQLIEIIGTVRMVSATRNHSVIRC